MPFIFLESSKCWNRVHHWKHTYACHWQIQGDAKDALSFPFFFFLVKIMPNNNVFQYDVYWPLQWPPLDVSIGGSLPRGLSLSRRNSVQRGGLCPEGGLCQGIYPEGGLSPERGLCLLCQGIYPEGGLCLERGLCLLPSPHADRMSDAAENITFPCGR